MSFDKTKPHNDLPDLPPDILLESHAVLKKTIDSHKALAALKYIGRLLPEQAVLIQTLGLQEAKMSSEIENIVTTNDDLYRACVDMDLQITAETKEVLHYQDAIWYGYETLKNKKKMLTTPLFEEVCQILKGHNSGLRKTGGTRLANQWGEIIYTPPEGEELIRKKLHNLEKFIYSEEGLDPLVKLALIHYQFESIHPFYDGNGRTGRILNILFLVDKGLLDLPILYLSRYFLQNKLAYYQGLRQVTEEGKWQEWICFFLEAIARTAEATQSRIFAIHGLMEETSKKIKTLLPRVYSKELVDLLFQRPYCKIRFLEEAEIAGRQTASIYLQDLEKIGVLRGVQIGREKYYTHDQFLHLLAQ